MSSLALAVPLMAQVAGAQSSAATTTQENSSTRVPFFKEFFPKAVSQEDVQAMIDRDNAFLSNIDAFIALQKEVTQNHRIALTAAADITDDTARQEAVQAAHEAQRTAIQAAIEANPDLAAGMHHGMGKGGHHSMKMRGGPGMLEEKFGMTMEELKAALDSGKTIEEIAAEKGIELPIHGEGESEDRGFFNFRAERSSGSSAQ